MINIYSSIARVRWLPSMQQHICKSHSKYFPPLRCFVIQRIFLFQRHVVQQLRQLYSPSSLGIIEYQNVRDRYKNMKPEILQSFLLKMEEVRADQTIANLVFQDDLKQLVHIVKNDDDIKLFEDLLSK